MLPCEVLCALYREMIKKYHCKVVCALYREDIRYGPRLFSDLDQLGLPVLFLKRLHKVNCSINT